MTRNGLVYFESYQCELISFGVLRKLSAPQLSAGPLCCAGSALFNRYLVGLVNAFYWRKNHSIRIVQNSIRFVCYKLKLSTSSVVHEITKQYKFITKKKQRKRCLRSEKLKFSGQRKYCNNYKFVHQLCYNITSTSS
jgi:hypothetical protein